jgi:hypothetical protein
MASAEKRMLYGTVEMDETYVGGRGTSDSPRRFLSTDPGFMTVLLQAFWAYSS